MTDTMRKENWNEGRLLSECLRLAAIMPEPSHFGFDIDGNRHLGFGVVAISAWYGPTQTQLRRFYGETFFDVLEKAEDWILDYIASRPRVMVAGDIGL